MLTATPLDLGRWPDLSLFDQTPAPYSELEPPSSHAQALLLWLDWIILDLPLDVHNSVVT